MPRWKYKDDRKSSSKDLFVNLKKNEPTKLKIEDWDFLKGHQSGAVFKCHVIEINGKPADKFWYVWDSELRDELKSKLKSRKAVASYVLTVTKKSDEDDLEEEYIVKWE